MSVVTSGSKPVSSSRVPRDTSATPLRDAEPAGAPAKNPVGRDLDETGAGRPQLRPVPSRARGAVPPVGRRTPGRVVDAMAQLLGSRNLVYPISEGGREHH